MTAFISAKVGRIYSDLEMVYKSLVIKVFKSLENLQQALRDLLTGPPNETLAACMVLLLYELHECTNGSISAYGTHQRGVELSILLWLRKPEA